MSTNSQTAKEMKELAESVQDVIAKHSAGEGGRRDCWSFFVKNIRSGYPLMELTLECVEAMTDDQRRRLLATLQRKSNS